MTITHESAWSVAIGFALFGSPLISASDDGACIVALRDGGGMRVGTLLRESPDGIELQIESDSGALVQFLRWDQIRAIDGDASVTARATRLRSGEHIWRGRFRLQQGDLRGARPCFLAAIAELETSASVERRIACEGVGRTASAAYDDWSKSVECALTAASLRNQSALKDQRISASDPFDSRCGLLLAVPPVWTDSASAHRAEVELVTASARACADSLGALGDLLECAARIAAADAGEPRTATPANPSTPAVANEAPDAAPEPARSSGFLGARLIESWANAVSSDALLRKRARADLRKISASEPGMARLWAIYAEGRSFSLESDPEEVRAGVGKMLLIPSAYAQEAPRLALAAIAQSAIALDRIQDDDAAAKLRSIQLEYQPGASNTITSQEGARH
ncbi:MAG: hypothetical protein EXS15_03945 [Phycisphaerales bacterium]|nr:hypothetical protein [Phycisphaerales bacterium]